MGSGVALLVSHILFPQLAPTYRGKAQAASSEGSQDISGLELPQNQSFQSQSALWVSLANVL